MKIDPAIIRAMNRENFAYLSRLKKATRYRAVGTRDTDGTFFHSKGELRRWEELKMLEKAGEISGLQRQVKFPLHVISPCGEVIQFACLTLDFVYNENGRKVFEDFKSPATAHDEAYRLRKRAFEAQYAQEITESYQRTR